MQMPQVILDISAFHDLPDDLIPFRLKLISGKYHTVIIKVTTKVNCILKLVQSQNI